MNPWIWAIGALVIAIAELHCPGCYLIWVAAGGAITALASFSFDVSLTAQLVIFVISSGATCILGYFIYQRLTNPRIDQNPINQREVTMVGTKGVVAVKIENGRGKVKLGDSVWLAEGPYLEYGVPVVVTDVRGTVVTVAPL